VRKEDKTGLTAYDDMNVPTLHSTVMVENKENRTKKRLGRPPKIKKKKGVMGRPKGDKAIMDEYRQRLIASPKSKKVLDVILTAALNDDHKHQAAAWKLLVERLMPISTFDPKAGNQQPSISINISGVGEVDIANLEPLEGDYESLEGEYEEDDQYDE